ncbi:hypothetical protein SISNIDRAFT_467593 [Sistotremastrum niveocremeum HHB9708]|uniref:Uncharacterized protein n=1 Tax=Sistotremastrum niveocremeum HHB9708 TaxID=1314777 RepID=A0A164SNQ5_9AGAM|nr:hypothetical protein SISNIDRAFT_467593 [Sistotremastrum niveocremeum HHB9708]
MTSLGYHAEVPLPGPRLDASALNSNAQASLLNPSETGDYRTRLQSDENHFDVKIFSQIEAILQLPSIGGTSDPPPPPLPPEPDDPLKCDASARSIVFALHAGCLDSQLFAGTETGPTARCWTRQMDNEKVYLRWHRSRHTHLSSVEQDTHLARQREFHHRKRRHDSRTIYKLQVEESSKAILARKQTNIYVEVSLAGYSREVQATNRPSDLQSGSAAAILASLTLELFIEEARAMAHGFSTFM